MQSISTPSLRLGRQPIFGREHQLLGYELLYRDDANRNSANVVDGQLATTCVLSNALLEIGLDHVIGDSRGFVNFTKNFLTGKSTIPLERDRIVVEVLEDVEIDEFVVAGLSRLKEQGYLIALDDFEYSPKWDPCLEIADIVKLDVLALNEKELADHVKLLKKYDVALLAEKVEDYGTHRMCMDLGFTLFQGYYFAKPDIIEEKRTSANRATLLETLAMVNDVEADADDIASSVAQDAILTHKLMRYVNSSAFGRRNKVDTPQQVIVYLGKDEVRSITTLLLLTSVEEKPAQLLKTALIRGYACQNVAKAQGIDKVSVYYTAGLFSMLDALLDQPMSQIMQELPLTDELKHAIVGHQGPIGVSLKHVIASERLETFFSREFPIDPLVCHNAYAKAVAAVEQGEGIAGMLPTENPFDTLDTLIARPSVVA